LRRHCPEGMRPPAAKTGCRSLPTGQTRAGQAEGIPAERMRVARQTAGMEAAHGRRFAPVPVPEVATGYPVPVNLAGRWALAGHSRVVPARARSAPDKK